MISYEHDSFDFFIKIIKHHQQKNLFLGFAPWVGDFCCCRGCGWGGTIWHHLGAFGITLGSLRSHFRIIAPF